MKYRPEIDGLRALAVLPVIFFHAGFEWFSGGFIGVDVFFVISGYLITTIILDDLENDRFSIVNFYERRARRILPALAIVCLAISIPSWIILSSLDVSKFGSAMLGVATFTSNFVFWRAQGYFDESAEFNPLLHTWSLAVEEQFYLFFPIFLLIAWRFGKRPIFWMIVAFSAISIIVSEWGWRNYPAANFYLAPTRVWELFFGSLAAIINQKQGVKGNNFLALIGLLAILAAIVFYNENTPFPSVYTLLPVLGATMLVLFADSKTLVAKILSAKVVVWLGLISYSAYLWHQPVLVFFRKLKGDIHISAVEGPLLLIFILALSYLTWKFIENPFRSKKGFSAKSIGVMSLVALSLIAGVGLLSINATKNYESDLAQQLVDAEYVYFANMDERKLAVHRLAFPLSPVSTLVMGSSRAMQIGSSMLGDTSLNISVSAATIEDDVALIGEAVAKLRPQRVLIGLDPWLLNKKNKIEAYTSIGYLYEHWSEAIGNNITLGGVSRSYFDQTDISTIYEKGLASRLFESVNLLGSAAAPDGSRKSVDKKSYDGVHIYNEKYASTPPAIFFRQFDGLLNYGMQDFEWDDEAEKDLRDLTSWLVSNGVVVELFLTPYHPVFFQRMVAEKPIYMQIEGRFIDLANDLGLRLLGSYDPNKVGCLEREFFDGMHPRGSCMAKALVKIERQDGGAR
jgi:peptidoglycan/LPS O-acetylase OafA/YrhL